MRILHIIRHPQNDIVGKLLEKQKEMGHKTALLLLQDGVYLRHARGDCGCDIFACREDMQARGLNTGERSVSYREIIEMVFSFDKVFTW